MQQAKKDVTTDLITIRGLKSSETALLADFLYTAIFIPEGVDRPDREIIHLPVLSVYIQDFGKKDDLCLVAETNGRLVGAIWTRIFAENGKGFGYVDAKTPELSMSVIKEFRNRGIGTKLLSVMLEKLAQIGYEQVSLSVDKVNYAYKMYRKFGFAFVKTEGESVTLLKKLKD